MSATNLPLPLPPEQGGESPSPVPAPPPPSRKLPEKPGFALTLGLCLAASAATALLVWATSSRPQARQPSSGPAGLMRTAVASTGELSKSLRVGGTLSTMDFSSIRAPRLRGPRDAGRADLTIAWLADAGTVVPPGAVVAEFELRWLEDHIADRQSYVVRAQSNYRKKESDILILKETERQGRVNSKAEYEKALLDVRTAEVRSEIEAEILSNVSEEALATWRQLEREGEFMELVHSADLRNEALNVRKEVLHVERHERDYERLRVRAPLGGMVVHETIFNKSGTFAQTKAGDQIYPGALIMRVVDVSAMVLNAVVNQVDAQAIRIGDEAVIELDAYPGEQFAGRVVDMGAVASSNSGGASRFSRGSSGAFIKHIRVRILIDDHDERILPDLSASADIYFSRSQEGVLVPREAVRAEVGEDREFVYVRDGEGFRQRPVRVRDVNDTQALIAQGLHAGEEVLVSEPAAASDSLQ